MKQAIKNKHDFLVENSIAKFNNLALKKGEPYQIGSKCFDVGRKTLLNKK